MRAVSLAFRRVLWAGLGLAAASLAVAVAGQARAAEAPQRAMGDPVNLYAPNADVYAPPSRRWGDSSPACARTGPAHGWRTGQSNVAVQAGDQGVLVVDTGTQAMAPKLLAQIQRLAQEDAGDQKPIRKVVNTNGIADHIGGNEAIRKAGSQIIAREEAAQQNAFVSPGPEVLANENVLKHLVAESTAGAAQSRQPLWPTDTEGFDIDNSRFNGEAVQFYHPHNANTDGQLIVLFRGSDAIAAGDVVDMATYAIIDVAAGGTIDGELVALN